MKIINVQANDYGEYICEGTNKLGVDGAEVKLYGKFVCYLEIQLFKSTWQNDWQRWYK